MGSGDFTYDAGDGNYMVINGKRFPVINSWVESEGSGRKRWGIVTEGEEQPAPPADATTHGNEGPPVTADPALIAACTPNSTPQAGVAEHGYQINVFDQDLKILATIDLPDWTAFRPVSAGHRLIEQGFMIRADARDLDKINGWTMTDGGWMAPLVRLEEPMKIEE